MVCYETDNPGKFVKNAGQLQAVVEKTAWRDPDTLYKPTGDAENILDKTLKFNELLDVGVSGAMGKKVLCGKQARKARRNLGRLSASATLRKASSLMGWQISLRDTLLRLSLSSRTIHWLVKSMQLHRTLLIMAERELRNLYMADRKLVKILCFVWSLEVLNAMTLQHLQIA